MGSKLVINRQKSSETVRSAGTNYRAKIAERIGDRLGADAGLAAGTLVDAAVADLDSRTNAMVTADDSFAATANLISTLLKLAGEDELASRVRPSTRKPGQTIEDAADDPELPETVSEQTAVDVA